MLSLLSPPLLRGGSSNLPLIISFAAQIADFFAAFLHQLELASGCSPESRLSVDVLAIAAAVELRVKRGRKVSEYFQRRSASPHLGPGVT